MEGSSKLAVVYGIRPWILPGYNILVIFVVTEEWFSFIESEPSYILAWAPHLPANYFSDFPDFFEQVLRKMEAPLEQLIDGLEIHMLVWVSV
ncbi:UDP-glucuronosyl/UDP-glucosyltransferase [Gossypium australe]|uniref:UDP-glucuronosyl/UDP-glucosyltransferase n=1 Tax=Gossypium australe TaxID=47621 RepID=A0A5B6X8F1_9ROSI|nr:UDP-glucuronosyl/UDP-glucosyltransferase [Gossypium australe]